MSENNLLKTWSSSLLVIVLVIGIIVVVQGSQASWKSLKIADSAGKSLNFGANVIQTKGKGVTSEILSR